MKKGKQGQARKKAPPPEKQGQSRRRCTR